MKLFKPLYELALRWSAHPRSPEILFGLSLVEAVFFPIAPEVMLAPMCLAQPRRSLRFASVSLAGSLLGALAGYALGHYAYALVEPLLSAHLRETFDAWIASLRMDMREHWWQLLLTLTIAALQPIIPMKVVTWASGIVGVPLAPFLACIAVGRGKRVYLLAGAIRVGGERAEAALHRWIEPVGWIGLLLLAALVAWLYLRGMHG